MAIIPQNFNDFLLDENKNFKMHLNELDYSWSEKKCSDMFDVITNANVKKNNTPKNNTKNNYIKNPQFIGSIIFTSNEKQDKTEYTVIDGQQRIITLFLFYIAAYKLVKQKSEIKEKPSLFVEYLSKTLFQPDDKFLITSEKFTSSEDYKNVFNYLLTADEIILTEELKPFKKLIKNFLYISQKIAEEKKISKVRTGLRKLVFVEIILEEKYAEFYTKLLHPEKEEDKDIRLYLQYNNTLGIKFAYSFLVQLYYDYGNNVIDKATFIEILSLVQTFCWRRYIVGTSTSGLSKFFTNLHSQIDENNYLYSVQKSLLKNYFPYDTVITAALKEKDISKIPYIYRYYLFEKIENYNSDSEEYVVLKPKKYDFQKYSAKEITNYFLKIWKIPDIPLDDENNGIIGFFKKFFKKIFGR